MRYFYFLLSALSMCLVSCMKQDVPETGSFTPVKGQSLFVINNGQFSYGNATLSCYDLQTRECENEIFALVNGFKLGDVAQSMTVYGDKGWVVVNNSHVIFAVGLSDMKVRGLITGITSPRNIHFVSDTKAYVTSMNDTKITVVNPQTFSIVKTIDVGYEIEMNDREGKPFMQKIGGEQMVEADGFLYVNLWSYGKEIVKIDLATDNVVGKLEVGIQPCGMALDADGRLMVMTDGGGWDGNPIGYEKPSLCSIDLETFAIDSSLEFSDYISVSNLQADKDGKTLYWLGNGVWKMDISASALPSAQFIPAEGKTVYALTVSPHNGDIFIGDAMDYEQKGKVYRYSSSGEPAGDFSVGVNPCGFCWY